VSHLEEEIGARTCYGAAMSRKEAAPAAHVNLATVLTEEDQPHGWRLAFLCEFFPGVRYGIAHLAQSAELPRGRQLLTLALGRGDIRDLHDDQCGGELK